MKVNVEYIGHIKSLIGNRRQEEVEIRDSAAVKDLLMSLSEEHGKPFQEAVYEQGGEDVKSNFIVTVNGYLLNQLNGVETRLKDGDRVILMSVVSGG